MRFTFEAAQSLPHLAEGHPCRRLHGHTYRIEIGAADPARLIEPARQIYNTLDHTYLNHTPGLEAATSERLCQWIWNRLAGEAQGVEAVIVQETETARCIYHGE
ncbi:MAG TPA: 6-carboxytetrahydropterin synthase [Candidatus Hydrogenedentes bacterium]|nr:6-carboxytetrahydropterin synthase [Candidatus Hydrogenedentota bacterium]HPG67141.1 6-carboxytetrahydropterin synthase [Candidatus Hydrogenedentota bacterium]